MSPIANHKISFFEPVKILRLLLALALIIPVVPLLSFPSKRLVIGVTLILFVAIVFLQYSRYLKFSITVIDPWIWAFIGITCLSIIWSSVPLESAKASIQEIAIPLVAIAILARGYSSSWLTTDLKILATFIMLISIVVCIIWPEQGIDYTDLKGNMWKGIMSHKNELGRLALLCVVCWTFTIRESGTPSIVWRLFIFVAAVAAIKFSDSASAFAIMAMVLVYFFISRTIHKGWGRIWYFIIPFFVIGLTYTLAIKIGYPTPREFLEIATGAVGRDATLTGRADLWIYTWNEIMSKPFLGSGYGSVWLERHTADIAAGADNVLNITDHPKYASQAHNSFLDIAHKTGLLGLGIWTVLIFNHVRRLIKIRHFQRDLADFHIALLMCAFGLSFFSTIIYRGLTGPWNIILWVSLIEVCYLYKSFMSMPQKIPDNKSVDSMNNL